MIKLPRNKACWLALLFILISALPPTIAAQDRPDEQAREVQIRAWLEPATDIIATQQVNLFVELATPGWFAGGTRISNFEIDDVVVLRRDQFSVNSTQRVEDQTWSVQLWTMTLYPQRAGQYLIPELEVNVTAANEGSEPSSTTLVTEAISFAATVPAELIEEFNSSATTNTESPWLATTRFEVSEHYSKDSNNLKVGDSIERVIEVKSENLAAMMLPALELAEPKSLQAGLAAYQQPAKIEDKVNRGDYLASRVDSVSYVIEKSGSYILPRIDLYWWDLANQTLQHEVLPERIISTENIALEVAESSSGSALTNSAKSDLSPVKLILLIFAAMIFAGLSFWYIRSRRFILNENKDIKINALSNEYKAVCIEGDYAKAVHVLYQWLNLRFAYSNLKMNPASLRQWLISVDASEATKLFDALMVAAHSPLNSPLNNTSNTAVKNNQELENLPKEIDKIIDSLQSERSIQKPFELRLN